MLENRSDRVNVDDLEVHDSDVYNYGRRHSGCGPAVIYTYIIETRYFDKKD